jgi:hypothetical protein
MRRPTLQDVELVVIVLLVAAGIGLLVYGTL